MNTLSLTIKIVTKSVFLFIVTLVSATDFIVEQHDWIGGDGVAGPVTIWGSQYALQESISTAISGKASLIATEWDYSNWVKHSIDSATIYESEFCIGFQPADIDADGDLDLVGFTDQLKWYENIGSFSYIAHEITSPPADMYVSVLFPADIDNDGDIDIVIALEQFYPSMAKLSWYENDGLLWHEHIISNNLNRYCVGGDVDSDGDIDIVSSPMDSITWDMTIMLYRNSGIGTFSAETVEFIGDGYAWRICLADLDDDGTLDISTATYNLDVYLNDGLGHFSHAVSDFDGISVDGMYPEDIDMDGDIDIIAGIASPGGPFPNYGFGAFLNDGSGSSFVAEMLWEDIYDEFTYEDGAIASDIDLDGFPDIAGTYSKVGWLRQSPTTPLEFTLYNVDSTFSDEPFSGSHWIYLADLDENCTPDIDILMTFMGEHIIYENRMLVSFASHGFLESSILDVGGTAAWKRIGWDACIPGDGSIAFYWRADNDPAALTSIPWLGPIYGDILDTPDSANIDGEGRYFQYMVEFYSGEDIAVLRRFWAGYDTVIYIPIFEIQLIDPPQNIFIGCDDQQIHFLVELDSLCSIDFSSVMLIIDGEDTFTLDSAWLSLDSLLRFQPDTSYWESGQHWFQLHLEDDCDNVFDSLYGG